MKWIDIEVEKPKETGPYIISASRIYGSGKLIFNYVAHYDAELDEWFEYSPFENKFNPTKKIDAQMLGWLKDVGVYLGVMN